MSSAVQTERNTVASCLRFISEHRFLQNKLVVVMIEGAPGTAASNFAGHFDEFAALYGVNIEFLYEMSDPDAVGVLKTHTISEQYRFCLEAVLGNRQLAIASDLHSFHPSNDGMKEIERLCEMILNYHYDEKKHSIHAKGDDQPDDILSALNQLLRWGVIFWKDLKYTRLRAPIVRQGYDFPFITSGVFPFNPYKRKR